MEHAGLCAVCGGLAEPPYSCRICGGIVCSRHFSKDKGLCSRCLSRTGQQ